MNNTMTRFQKHSAWLPCFFLLSVAGGALLFFTPFVGAQPIDIETPRDLLAVAEPPLTAPTPAAPVAPPRPSGKDEKRQKLVESFWSGSFPSVEISFDPKEWENLKRDNRRYAKGMLVERAKTFKEVAVKLKGSMGSFQGPDGKPGLTLSFNHYKKSEPLHEKSEPFHGLKKIHFNNCAQDVTYLHEQIAGEIARKAGVPASRCSHGFVKWQGRELGLYVTKEAFNKDFLGAFYKSVDGDLYDGGSLLDLEEKMEKDQGDPMEKAALKELIAASKEGDNAKRWERLGKILDVDLFASYLAIEVTLSHWDGYSFHRNNYRLYRDPDTGKFSFLLHGMDQTFKDPNFPVMPKSEALVTSAFMRCPEGQRLYKAKLDSIYANVIKPIDWGARVSEVGGRVQEALVAKNPRLGKDYASRISEARTSVTNRIAALGRMLEDMP